MSISPTQRVEILRASCCVAGADGECSPEEMRLLQRLASDVGVGKASFTAMRERATRDPDFHKLQLRVLNAEPRKTMGILLDVAIVDGDLDEKESRVLYGLAENLGLSRDDLQELLEEAKARRTGG